LLPTITAYFVLVVTFALPSSITEGKYDNLKTCYTESTTDDIHFV